LDTKRLTFFHRLAEIKSAMARASKSPLGIVRKKVG